MMTWLIALLLLYYVLDKAALFGCLMMSQKKLNGLSQADGKDITNEY